MPVTTKIVILIPAYAWQGTLDTAVCDKVWQGLSEGRCSFLWLLWFLPLIKLTAMTLMKYYWKWCLTPINQTKPLLQFGILLSCRYSHIIFKNESIETISHFTSWTKLVIVYRHANSMINVWCIILNLEWYIWTDILNTVVLWHGMN